MVDEIAITKRIVDRFHQEFVDALTCDVAIAGSGPSGLVASYYLAEQDKRVVVFERELNCGGGIWGGGMGMPIVVIQENAKQILDELGIKYRDAGEGYYTAHAIELVSRLCAGVLRKGVKIFNGIAVEDVMLRGECIHGFVINLNAMQVANLHVDPLTIKANYCVDATGHAAEVCRVVERKTQMIEIRGEKPMEAELGENLVVENSREIYPGLFVCGMAANAVFGAPRMGPIFGGMMLSGKRVAELILKEK